MIKWPLAIFLSLVLLWEPSRVVAEGDDYYVSVTGSDSNNGSAAAPFKSFAKGVSSLRPGDKLNIYEGTYHEQLNVNVSGSLNAPISIKPVTGQRVIIDGEYRIATPVLVPADKQNIKLSGLEITGGGFECVLVRGSNVVLDGLDVHHCQEFGYRLNGAQITVENSQCRDSVTENAGGISTGGGWGACMRTAPGSSEIVIRNNRIFNNWGEGLIIGQAAGLKAYNNTVYDNYSVNIYIGNAYNIDVYNNMTYSTNPAYYRSGNPANCISVSEESISEAWGARLSNVKVFNNIAYGCKIGLGYTYKEVADNGCNNCLFAHNTLVDTGGIKVIPGAKNHIVIANNILKGGSISIPTGEDITLQANFTQDPLFVAIPGTDPENYRLSVNSPAIDSAVPFPEVVTDFAGGPRGNKPDVGAWEYGTIEALTPAAKQGDANNDNVVDEQDYEIWKSNFLTSSSGATNGDFDENGAVDGVDYVLWVNNYGA